MPLAFAQTPSSRARAWAPERRRWAAFGLLLVGVLVAFYWLLTPTRIESDLRVAVASNFAPAAKLLAAAFHANTGHQAQMIVGSTGKHYAQILGGAPYDVFLAADSVRPRLLESAQRIVPGSRITYAVGRLAAWSPGGARPRTHAERSRESTADMGPNIIETLRTGRVSLANPRLAPYGVAADSVLHQLGSVGSRVLGENVSQALQFATAGGADVALAAFSQVKEREDGAVWVVPDSLYPPIVQQAVLLTDSDATRRFMLFMVSPEAESIIRDTGYRGAGYSVAGHRVARTHD